MNASQSNSEYSKATFRPNERLKSKKKLDLLFTRGKALNDFPVQVIYYLYESEGDSELQAAFSVPKRNFKLAVDRNRIKRQMKESYRKVKVDLKKDLHSKKMSLLLMWVYKAKYKSKYADIEHKIIKSVNRLQHIVVEADGSENL
jgi:ribonuclease P protein component